MTERLTVTRAICVICAVTVLGATGCGTSAPQVPAASTDAHAAFLASVTRVCQRAVDAHRGHPFPIPDFDPLHPDPGQLPAIGDYFAAYGGPQETGRALHALHPSTVDAATWTQVLALVDRVAANAQRQIDAAQARDVGAFVATVRAGQSLTDRLNAAADRLGLRSGSACAQVFG